MASFSIDLASSRPRQPTGCVATDWLWLSVSEWSSGTVGLHYFPLDEIIIPDWSFPARVGIMILRIICGRAIAVMVMVT